MLVIVIKSFPYSVDGINQQHAHARPEAQEVPDFLVPSLIADGYVEPPEDHPPVAMTPHRRKVIEDRVTTLFRAHLEALSDEKLLMCAEQAERQSKEAADELAARQAAADQHSDFAQARADESLAPGGADAPEPAASSALIPGQVVTLDVKLYDVLYRNPRTGEQFADKGLTKTEADERAAKWAGGDEPAADIRIVPHVADPVPAVPPAEIPSDWKGMHWKHRVALAKKLGWADGEPSADQADGWIADVLVQRERAKPLEALGGLSIAEAHDALTKAGVEWTADTTVEDLAALLDTVKGLAEADEGAGK